MTCLCCACFWNLISKDLNGLRLPNYLAAEIWRLLRSHFWGWGWDNLKAGVLWSCQLECQNIASSCDLGFLAIWHPKDGGSELKLLRGSCRAFWGLALQVTGVTSAYTIAQSNHKSAPIQKEVRRCHFTVGGLLQSSY